MAAMAEGKVEDPADIFSWKGHAKRTTCASMSPNSQWVVSGDISGALRLWGAKGDHIQKNEYKLWDGTIQDVGWSSDSTRIMAAGDGKEVRAAALMWDTGSKTGEVAGHVKAVSSISFRSQRPFRIVTGGQDKLVCFHQGPPFKFARQHTVHSNFVNCVRYSPNGDWVFSAGSDSKLVLYEGKDGELLKEFAAPPGITGSIWDAAWSPDSAQVVTAGGDKKLRIWGLEAAAQLAEAHVGDSLEDMQLGVAWPKPGLVVSVCLDGRILLWDVASSGELTLKATADGTQGPLSCLACDKRSGTLVQAGPEGSVAIVQPGRSPLKAKIGKGVTNVLAHSSSSSGPAEAWIFSLDACARRVSLETGEFLGAAVEVKEIVVGADWLDVAEATAVVATSKGNILCLSSTGIQWCDTGKLPRRPTALAARPPDGRLAIAIDKPDGAGIRPNQYHIMLFSVAEGDDHVVPTVTLEQHQGEVCALRFSPDGSMLASSDAEKKILVWDLSAEVPVVKISDWCMHTARITCLDWLQGGKHVVSGSLDRHIYVWSTEDSSRIEIKEAHKGGVTALAACSENSFASVGADGFLLIHGL